MPGSRGVDASVSSFSGEADGGRRLGMELPLELLRAARLDRTGLGPAPAGKTLDPGPRGLISCPGPPAARRGTVAEDGASAPAIVEPQAALASAIRRSAMPSVTCSGGSFSRAAVSNTSSRVAPIPDTGPSARSQL